MNDFTEWVPYYLSGGPPELPVNYLVHLKEKERPLPSFSGSGISEHFRSF